MRGREVRTSLVRFQLGRKKKRSIVWPGFTMALDFAVRRETLPLCVRKHCLLTRRQDF